MADDKQSFGEWLTAQFNDWKIKKFQETGDWPSKKDFADFLGKHPVNVGLWMDGQRIPKDQNIYDLADKLGSGVFTALGIPEPIPEDLRDLVCKISKIPPEDRHELDAFLDRIIKRRGDSKQPGPKAEARAVPC